MVKSLHFFNSGASILQARSRLFIKSSAEFALPSYMATLSPKSSMLFIVMTGNQNIFLTRTQLPISARFEIVSLTETFYPLELHYCVKKLNKKGKGLKPSNNIATSALDFLGILPLIYLMRCILFGNTYYIMHSFKYFSPPQDYFVSGVDHPERLF